MMRGHRWTRRLRAYQELIAAGKVRAIGASNYKGARLAKAMEVALGAGVPAYTALQPEYNLYDREDYEQDLAPVVAQYGLGVIPYYSLASGFLTGKYKTKAGCGGQGARRQGGEILRRARGERILKALAEVAGETGAKEASVALAWLMAQPGITAPIASATSVEQMKDLAAAVTLKLSHEQVRALTEASAY